MESTKFINAQHTKTVHLYRNTKEKLFLKYVDLLVILCKLNVAVGVCNSYTIIYYTILYYTILYYTILYYTILLKFFNHLICVLPVLLHTRDIASHECSFLS